MKMKASGKIQTLTQLALMSAIIAVMSLTPLGYIRTPALSITLLTIPVAIGAMILGPLGGIVCGTVFGLTSFIQCFGMTAFGSALLQISLFGTLVTTIVTRILVGFLSALIFKAVRKTRFKKAAFYITSLACPLLNTVLFMSSLVLFFYNCDYIQAFVNTLGATNPFMFVLGFVGVQGVIEAIICFIVSSAISQILWKVLKKGK